MDVPYNIPSQGHITDQTQQHSTLYTDDSSNVPQSHHPFPPQQFYPGPRAHLQFQGQSQVPFHAHRPPELSLHYQHQQIPPSHPQMQHAPFNGYNPNDASSMPPPMGAMNMNIGGTMQQMMPQRTPQSYQAHMRSNSQHMPSSNSAYMQSPIPHNTPTPPSGALSGQPPFIPQPSHSPTKVTAPSSAPTSQPQMAPSASPQNALNPFPKPQATTPTEQVPLSPGAQKRETKKIDLLLEINRFLFQEIVQLQAAGRGGAAQNRGSESTAQGGQQSPTAAERGKDTTSEVPKDSSVTDSETRPEDKDKKPVAREYIECMRRLQANFAYLTNLVSRPQKQQDKIIERPPIMEGLGMIEGNTMSEESLQSLRDMYKNLRDLFPTPPPGGSMVQFQRPGLDQSTADGNSRNRAVAAQAQMLKQAQAAQQQQLMQAQAQAQVQTQGQVPGMSGGATSVG